MVLLLWWRDRLLGATVPSARRPSRGPRPRPGTAYAAQSPFAIVPFTGTGYVGEVDTGPADPPSRGKEGSRHKRQRARRAAARVALRLGSAAQLLGEHHSRQRPDISSFEAVKRAKRAIGTMTGSGSRPSSAPGQRAQPSTASLRPATPRDVGGGLSSASSQAAAVDPGPWQCGACGIYDNWWDKSRCRRCGAFKDATAVSHAVGDGKGGEGKKGKKGKKDKDKGGRKGGKPGGDQGIGAGGKGGGGASSGGSARSGRDLSPLTRATQQHQESLTQWGETSPITIALAVRIEELTEEKFRQKPVANLWDEANVEVQRLEALVEQLNSKLLEARQVVDLIAGEKAVAVGALHKATERREQCRVAAATELRGVDPSANKALADADALLAKLKDGLVKQLPLDPSEALKQIDILQKQLAQAKGAPAPVSPPKRGISDVDGSSSGGSGDVQMQLPKEDAEGAGKGSIVDNSPPHDPEL